jgi:hypothetical protein
MGSSYSTYISVNLFFIHRTCVHHLVPAIYFASVVDKDIDDCFFLSQDIKHSPKYIVAPLVLRRSSMQPTQSTSVLVISDRSFPFGYHNPNSFAPLRYLIILFTYNTCDSFGAA